MGDAADSGSSVERKDPGPNRRDNLIQAGLDPDVFEEFEEFRVAREFSTSEATRQLVRQGLEDEDLSERIDELRADVERLRDERKEAEERGRDAVEEMRDVRSQWQRERLHVMVLIFIGTLGLYGVAQGYPLIGVVVFFGTVILSVLFLSGIIDTLRGRGESPKGLTEPPNFDDEVGGVDPDTSRADADHTGEDPIVDEDREDTTDTHTERNVS